jgi:hypothetical protein
MRRPTALFLALFVFSCGQGLSCGNGCMGFGPIPGGVFTGVRSDSAASARLSSSGFDLINMSSPQLLAIIAPTGNLDIPLGCSIQNASILGQLVVGDEGGPACTQTSCGYMDGVCDAKDVPKTISVHFNNFSLAPKGPDQIVATADITLTTNGKIHADSPTRSSIFCAFADPLELSIDLDTQRHPPTDVTLAVGIQMTVDARWWKLLTLDVAGIDGTKACGSSGALPSPECIDPADLVVASENSCSGWLGTLGNIDAIKGLLLGQITSTLQKQVQNALNKANCRHCDDFGQCPTNGMATSMCIYDDGGTPDAGTCYDPMEQRCVPALLGVEGRIDVGTALAAAGAPAGAGLDISIAAGGSTTASSTGFTLGFTGGAQEVQTASCVKPLPDPMLPAIPLPDFDAQAGGPYDVGVSVSQELLTRMLLHAEQSGALCLELGHDTISLLDSSLVGTLLPSLNALTGGKTVPMRIVIRPVNPPTAAVGAGTSTQPLVTLNWDDTQIDVYARLEDRYARLFSVTFDLALPLSLSLDGCSTVTPVIGDLMNAVTDVHATNSEILAEPLSAVEQLVPSLISFAEPSLSKGLTGFTLPPVSFAPDAGFQIELTEAKGLGNVSGTQTYNHLGLYANLVPVSQPCIPTMTPSPYASAAKLHRKEGRAELDVGTWDREYSFRMPDGLWSFWQRADASGIVSVRHPRLKLDGQDLVELRARTKGSVVSQPVSVRLVDAEAHAAVER